MLALSLSSKQITVSTKKRLLKALVWSVASYMVPRAGLTRWIYRGRFRLLSWQITARYSEFHRLRRNPTMDVGTNWQRPWTVAEFEKAHYGHILGTEGDTLEKDIIVVATPGRRRKGRPQRRWVKDIEDCRMGLQINTAAGLASDRRQWREDVRHSADPSTKDGTWLDLYATGRIALDASLAVTPYAVCLSVNAYQYLTAWVMLVQ